MVTEIPMDPGTSVARAFEQTHSNGDAYHRTHAFDPSRGVRYTAGSESRRVRKRYLGEGRSWKKDKKREGTKPQFLGGGMIFYHVSPLPYSTTNDVVG